MSENSIKLHYSIPYDDFSLAGEASSNVKKMLVQLGVNPVIVKRTAISMYEAEINAAIHAGGGEAEIEIIDDRIVIFIKDSGPGIPDIGLAMTEGFSTAPDTVCEMGFGAGMGLPNIQRHADSLEIMTEVGKGTTVKIVVFLG